jgi:hypothetical protein
VRFRAPLLHLHNQYLRKMASTSVQGMHHSEQLHEGTARTPKLCKSSLVSFYHKLKGNTKFHLLIPKYKSIACFTHSFLPASFLHLALLFLTCLCLPLQYGTSLMKLVHIFLLSITHGYSNWLLLNFACDFIFLQN